MHCTAVLSSQQPGPCEASSHQPGPCEASVTNLECYAPRILLKFVIHCIPVCIPDHHDDKYI